MTGVQTCALPISANIETKSRVAAPVVAGTANFTISSLLFAQKTWNYLNRVLAAGGTLDDWQEVTYDVQRWSKPEKGIYEGGLSRELSPGGGGQISAILSLKDCPPPRIFIPAKNKI